jgi:predicted HAD superfamily Cof-like phosphohydrolase
MSNILEKVTEFHTTFGHPIGEKPQVPEPDVMDLRVALIFEENKELAEAAGNIGHFRKLCAKALGFDVEDAKLMKSLGINLEERTETSIVGVADALADIDYVTAGAVVVTGLTEVFPKIQDEVHYSNMTKACKTKKEAEAAIAHYKELGEKITTKKIGGKYVLFKVNGKVAKNPNYHEANLAQFFNAEKN